ncbi:MAG: lytic transglycosylase domain-containing protein [Chloroflexi bacterium]|nr:MAG: lytic transglycosylase domain-containing protein [Chloroflexota bacterium]TMB93985.1 MAG: lytic transglycosylase domain-containing protein [Chloroflexota bacterium]TMC29658.1 MAG: lytic transglycosylase domain-containing protein [Chloroflexota bacterium]TMC32908.1 MAG: lytic transglycosylase domain-containing protein [Chloroflexota bacterium]TMC58494.1 MAG: lytic transglycosylase domain-containing protein [Chloroflexota bacterium]
MVRKSVVRGATVGLAALFLAACSAGAVSPNDNDGVESRPVPAIRYTPEPTAAPTNAATLAPKPSATAAPDWSAVPLAANDATGVAQQLVMVEAMLRDPGVSGAQLNSAGHLEQLLFGRLADYPEWRDAVLAALPAAQRDVVKNGLDAGKQLRMLSGPIPSRLPDWKIVEPAPIEELLSYYKEAQDTFGIDWEYLAAIHLVETRMGRIRGLSSAGAQGPMQFMPATWAMYGKGDINDNHDAIMGAARYLKAAGAPGNMQKALFAYNHAQAYVNALLLYAESMKLDQNAYRGYHGWQVYYPTKDGPVLLKAGWVNG